MKKTLILLPLLVVAACATPRERCISSANRAVSTLDGLIAETRGNVQRGYTIEQFQDVRVLRSTCVGRNADGSTFRFACDETETVNREVPVAINIAEERLKLTQLEQRRAAAASAANTRIQQCIAVYPE